MACDGRFIDKNTAYSVIFEDDGRVAYAYLLDESEAVCADVWLYNRCITPEEPEWEDMHKLPFVNSNTYVNRPLHDAFRVVETEADVDVKWSTVARKIRADVFIRNKLVATLVEGAKPSWSLLACKNGPLANVLEP